MIFNLNEIPYLKRGSGVMLFKSKGYQIFNFCTLDKTFSIYDSDEKKINFKNLTHYFSKRGKSGKNINFKSNIKLFRGYRDNFKF